MKQRKFSIKDPYKIQPNIIKTKFSPSFNLKPKNQFTLNELCQFDYPYKNTIEFASTADSAQDQTSYNQFSKKPFLNIKDLIKTQKTPQIQNLPQIDDISVIRPNSEENTQKNKIINYQKMHFKLIKQTIKTNKIKLKKENTQQNIIINQQKQENEKKFYIKEFKRHLSPKAVTNINKTAFKTKEEIFSELSSIIKQEENLQSQIGKTFVFDQLPTNRSKLKKSIFSSEKLQIIKDNNDSLNTIDSGFIADEITENNHNGYVKKWIQQEIIGSGKYAQVYKAQDPESHEVFVVKQIMLINDDDGEIEEGIKIELSILKNLRHEHIIGYINHEKIDKSIYIYLEYMSHGNLSAYMEQNGPIKEPELTKFSEQILKGIIFLHENKVIHKDIKASNILLNHAGVLKLADFNCARSIEKTLTSCLDQNFQDAIKGSIPWMAPEVIKQTKYGRKSDVWSYGCTLIELISGKNPWSECNFDNPVAAIMKIGISSDIPQIPININNKLFDLIFKCLQRDYELRTTSQDLLIHPFFKQ